MKKFFEWWKIWTILAVLIFAMTFWLVAYSGSNPSFVQFKAQPMREVLTANSWDDLMDELNSLRSKVDELIQNQQNSWIPEWMIAPFLDDCPPWWNWYSSATVPGWSVIKLWCVKWDAPNGITIRLRTLAVYLDTSMWSSYTVFNAFSPTVKSVEPGTTIQRSNSAVNSIKIWSETFTASTGKVVAGRTWKFQSIDNECGATAQSTCDITAFYYEQ